MEQRVQHLCVVSMNGRTSSASPPRTRSSSTSRGSDRRRVSVLPVTPPLWRAPPNRRRSARGRAGTRATRNSSTSTSPAGSSGATGFVTTARSTWCARMRSASPSGRSLRSMATTVGCSLPVAAFGSSNVTALFARSSTSRHGRLAVNDGCDAAGRCWAGSLADDRRVGGGALHLLDRNSATRSVLDGLTIPNGIGWSLDGSTMYLVDLPAWSSPSISTR